MTFYAPDPVTVEVLAQGEQQPCRIRLTLPDGSGVSGELDPGSIQINLDAIQAGDEEHIGQALYEVLFPARLSEFFQTAVRAAGGRGVRLALRLDPSLPLLHHIPWERLYYPAGENWSPLAAASNITFSRSLQTGSPWELPLPSGPIRVLVAISSPFPEDSSLAIDTEAEIQKITDVFQKASSLFEVEILAGSISIQQLADRLNQGPGFDILHYLGHGEWKSQDETGYLIFNKRYEDGETGPVGVSAAEFAKIISTALRLPQLIFLSACESGQQSTNDAFAGVGPKLVSSGCPAVVCMQKKVEMETARQFAATFYRQLLESGCVDLAVNRARAGLLASPFSQWAIPALYMHLSDGILFFPEQRFKPAQREPYKSLRPYQLDDRDLFKGRGNVAAAVIKNIKENQITVITGEAGIGLTSLLEAGVRPVLEEQGFRVVRICDYHDLTSEIRLQYQTNGHPIPLPIPGDARLPVILKAINLGARTGLVFELDQFERVFLLPEGDQAVIAEALQESLQTVGSGLRLIAAVHKERTGELTRFQKVFGQQSGSWIEISPLEPEQAVEAILQPLDVLGWPVTISKDLVRDQIVPDLSSLAAESSGAVPGSSWIDPGQLQITCTWLYQNARLLHPPLVDETVYLKQGGGADGILARYLQDELRSQFADQSDFALILLQKMAAPEQDHWVNPEQLHLEDFQPDKLARLLDRMVQAELLVRSLKEGRYVYAFASSVIAEEVIRIGSKEIQQSYNAGDELERAWRLWLAAQVNIPPGSLDADLTLPSRRQLHFLAENLEHFEPRPVKILMLLRSAIVLGETASPWFDWLAKKEEGVRLVQLLDAPIKASREGSSASELGGRLMGFNNPDLANQAKGNDIGSLAWTAVHSSDPVSRQSAALACCALPAGTVGALDQIERELVAPGVKSSSFMRRAELYSALMDNGVFPDARSAGAVMKSLPYIDRLGIYTRRAARRFFRGGRRTMLLALGSGTGAGLALGVERLIVGAFSGSQLATIFFALFSYWGLILAGLTSFGLSAVGPLLLETEISPPHPQRDVLQVFLGTIAFGIANLVVAVLNGISISRAPLVVLLGFTAGLGFAQALAFAEKSKIKNLIPRLVISSLVFMLVQTIFLVWPDSGSGIAISLSGGFFQVEYDHFSSAGWQNWIQSYPDWFKVLSLIETGLAGLALTAGAAFGRRTASSWLKSWSRILNQVTG